MRIDANPGAQAQAARTQSASTPHSNRLSTQAADSEPASAPEAAKGVMRLLEAGHFKGVADVRLRINFNSELQAVSTQKTGQAVQENAVLIQQSVNVGIEAILSAEGIGEEAAALVGEAAGAFSAAVDELLAPFLAGSGGGETLLARDLASAFEELVDTIAPALAPTIESEAGFEGLLDGLRSSFDSALGKLQEALDSTALPVLSAPSGNGRAYDRFLAEYEAMRAPAAETSPETVFDATV